MQLPAGVLSLPALLRAYTPRPALSVELRLALVLAATIAASLYANLSAAPGGAEARGRETASGS